MYALSLPLLAIAFERIHAVVSGLLVRVVIFVLVILQPGARQAVDTRLVWALFAWSNVGLRWGARFLDRFDHAAELLVESC